MSPTRANPVSLSVPSSSLATAYIPLLDLIPSMIIVVASWGAQKNLTVYGTTSCALFVSPSHSQWSGTGECIPPKAIFRLKKEQIAVRSDRLCILVSGLVDAFVTAFNRNLKILKAYVW